MIETPDRDPTVMSPAHLDRLSTFLTPERRLRLRQVLDRRTRHLLVVLENLLDPHNASACVRSCEACGLQEVHVIEELAPFDTTLGVARGSDRWIHLVHHRPAPGDGPGSVTARALTELKQCGYRTVAMTPHPEETRAVAFHELPIDRPLALVFGTEKKGLSRTALDLCDLHTQLPIEGFVESYNVSVACALATFSLGGRIRQELSPNTWQLPASDREALLIQWTRLSIRRIAEIEASLATEDSCARESPPD